MESSAEAAWDLVTTPRNPIDLMAACEQHWGVYGYNLTYSTFRAWLAYAESFAGSAPVSAVHTFLMPMPPANVLGATGSETGGRETAEAVSAYNERVTTALALGESPAEGPSLEDLDGIYQAKVAFVYAVLTGTGMLTAEFQHDDAAAARHLVRVQEALASLGP